MRTTYSEIPTYQELCAILAHEEKRQIPHEKDHIHYGDFTTIIDLLKSYQLPTLFFEDNIKFEDFKNEKLFFDVEKLFTDLNQSIFDTKEDSSKIELFNNLYDYLSEEDELQKADIIFVFGSK